MQKSDENIHARWFIEAQLQVSKPIELLLHDLREAIRSATHFDQRRINTNFPVDWDACAEVKRLMEMLVSLGTLADAMEIAVHFMREASSQIEHSDEGRMLPEVEACLLPILEALESFDAAKRSEWAFRMQVADRVGCVCRDRLRAWWSPAQ
ncbi:MAG: hypothetical protein U0939_17840 [Pirellulales bacterium]